MRAVVLGIAETFRDNAAQVIVSALVPTHRLEWANGRRASLESITNRFIGPPLGGVLAGLSLTLPFVFDAATFAIAAAALAFVGGSYRPIDLGPPRHILPGIKSGLDWLRAPRPTPHPRPTARRTHLPGHCRRSDPRPLRRQDVLGLGDLGYGLLISAGAIGAVISGTITARIVDRRGRHRTLISAALVYGVAQLCLGIATTACLFAIAMAVGALSAVTWTSSPYRSARPSCPTTCSAESTAPTGFLDGERCQSAPSVAESSPTQRISTSRSSQAAHS